MKPLTVAILACTILLAGDALGHMPTGDMVWAVHLEDGQTPIIDGELDDWEGIAPVLRMSDFGDLVAGAEPDAADFDVRVWIGWNDNENRLYLAVEVDDDIHQIDRPEGSATTRIFQDDDLEVFVDADHSGGQYADFSDLDPDEQLARNELCFQLERSADVQVVGQAADGVQTVALAQSLVPDLVLLDVQMPGMTGFEVAHQLLEQGIQTQVVFVTAFDQYAINAFEVNAVDYLLKPVEASKLVSKTPIYEALAAIFLEDLRQEDEERSAA